MTKNTITKLKIGFVLDDGLDKPDGVQQYILALGRWFEENGHQVQFLVGESKRKDIPGLIELSKNLKVSFNGNRLSMPIWPKNKKIKKVLKQENFDVIHIQVPFSPIMGLRVLNSVPKSAAIVGTFHILPLNDSFFYRIGNKIVALSIRSGLKKIDKHFSVSKPAQDFAKQVYKIDSQVLGNPIKISNKLINKKNFQSIDNFRIVFLGRLVPRKGCKTLLEAVNHLDPRLKDKITIKIGGTGTEQESLQRYVSKHNLDKNVKFYGFISENDKLEFLKESDMAVFPSKGGESFGIVLTEAMAAAGPVVFAGDNPGYRSVLESDEALFDPEDPKALAAKIRHFITKPSDLNTLFKHQQKLVENYDLDKIAGELLVNFRSIVQNKSK